MMATRLSKKPLKRMVGRRRPPTANGKALGRRGFSTPNQIRALGKPVISGTLPSQFLLGSRKIWVPE